MERGDRTFEAAFDQLFRRAFVVGRRFLPPPAAEDVAAEACARAYAAWSRIGGFEWREAWVARVAANLAIDAVRRRPPSSEQDDPVDPTAGITRRLVVADALRRLPKRQRDVVVLRYFADLTEQEAAAALGVSVGSVKTHAHRALHTLRSALGDAHEEASLVLT